MIDTIKWGDRGEAVTAWQKTLVLLGHPVKVDGIFGDETYYATRDFQSSAGAQVDGAVGRQTLEAAMQRLGLSQATSLPSIGPIDRNSAITLPEQVVKGESVAKAGVSPLLWILGGAFLLSRKG